MTVTDIKDNPGLFPLNKGKALLQESTWTLFKILDYSPIISNYLELRNNIIKVVALLTNKSFDVAHDKRNVCKNYSCTDKFTEQNFISFNYDTQLQILQNYLTEADKLLNQLFPEQKLRPKRALIDGLGSLVKLITGNLDASDGQKFENQINTLTKSTDQQKTILLEQAQILNETIQIFSDNLERISKNQKTLNKNLNTLILDTKIEINNILGTLTTNTLLEQSIQSLQLFINTWSNLETSLTFAQNQQLHLSLIDNDNLLNALTNISQNLIELQLYNQKSLSLPYPINYQTLHLYESIIQLKIYQKSETLTFIYEIPLIKSSTDYQYIQLIPFPAYNEHNHFHMTIPTYRNILFNTESSIPLEDNHCRQSSDHYFCQQPYHFSIPNEKLCETQLLAFTINQTCQPYLFQLNTYKISQINKSTWILSSPIEIIIDLKCPNSKNRKTVIGSSLIQITNDCSVIVNQQDILFSADSSVKETINQISISKLQVPFVIAENLTISKIDLTHINMHVLQENQLKLQKEKQILVKSVESTTSMHLSLIAIALISIFVLITILSILYLYKCKRNSFIIKLQQLLNSNKTNEADIANPVPLVQIRS